MCATLGYEFAHHDALEDAKAAAHVVLAAIKETGIGLADWLQRVEQPIDPFSGSGQIARDGSPTGSFYGEFLVFTGTLSMLRIEAAHLAAKLGFSVRDTVTKKTTVLVVGDQDIRRLNGHEISAKHRKAEELIRNGHPIRILTESDFEKLVACVG